MRSPGGFDFFISDPLHHYTETAVLKGIKERAEGYRMSTRAEQNLDRTSRSRWPPQPLAGEPRRVLQ
jgi:hypothetical protein